MTSICGWFEKKGIRRTGAVGPLIAGVLFVLSVLFGTVLFGTGTLAVAQEVQLANGYALKIIDRISVAVSSGSRDYHGPCVCRAPNGDLLLCHKDAYTHGGGDGYVHQWRSTDDGFNWTDEGVAARWTDQGLDSLFGEYTVAPDGNRMAMLVQRREIYGGNAGVISSVWYTSENNGSTWDLRSSPGNPDGEMDPIEPEGVLYASSPFSHDGTAYVGAYSPLGHALYVSTDNVESWERRSVIFQHDTHPDFSELADRGPPYYPRVMRLPDGRLMAMCYVTPSVNRCYTRFSDDDGYTWGPIEKRDDLPLWAPRMNCIDDEVLVVTGRYYTNSTTAAIFSVDDGETWNNKLTIDGPASSSYGYSDSIQISEDRFWVFTSSSGNIVGVLLDVTAPIPGDANNDGIVDDEDASILAGNWRQTGMGWGDGDFNKDQIVNDADASILAAHWQESQEGGAPVPEPSSVGLLVALGLGVLVGRSRRKRRTE